MSTNNNIDNSASKNLQKSAKEIYFIGIGGIGMSAIARYYNAIGVKVSGYDKTETNLTKQLQQEGIDIHFEDDINLAPKEVDYVVYTPAIPKTHAQLNYYFNNNYVVYKRSDVLKIITENSFNICVAGTHGKTTTSTIVGHLLRDTGYGCNAFLGGIATNYNTNFWSNPQNNVVVEADEYDRSFLKLSPNIAIITAVDADHLDIYGTAEEFEKTFVEFTEKIKPTGCLIIKHGLPILNQITTQDVCTYSVSDSNANIHVKNLQVINGSYVFDVINNYWTIKDVELNMGGLHNIENALAAIGVAKYLKIEDEKIKQALANFRGVKRRFEYVLKPSHIAPSTETNNAVLIDDYAHHPDELKALITGVRSIYPNKKLTLVFQPHLFSRTKDFANEFAASLSLADEVILLPIYPARELPIEGVTSELLLNKITINNKLLLSKEALLQYMQQNKPTLVVMAGAGDIDVLVQPVKNILSH